MWKPPVRHEITRQALYELIWTEPVYKVAIRYKISGVALAKIARNAGIPLPPRGYWARLLHGKKPRKTPLKPAAPGKSEALVLREGEGPRGPRPPKPEMDPAIAQVIAEIRSDEHQLVVPDHVTRLHPEAKKMAESMERSRPWNARKEPISSLEMRRRRILDTLFRAFAARRWSVEAISDVGFDVEIFGSEHALTCSEPVRRKRIPLTKVELRARQEWDRRDFRTVDEPSGLLRIKTSRGGGHQKEFLDSDGAPLESQLNDVIVWLLERSISIAERDRRKEAARLAAIESQKRQREIEIARWEEQERRRREVEKRKELFEQVKMWTSAIELRQYAAAAVDAGFKDSEWQKWVCDIADSMDPLAVEDDEEATETCPMSDAEHRAMKAALSAVVVPIVVYVREKDDIGPRFISSGTLTAFDDLRLIITAAHVLTKYAEIAEGRNAFIQAGLVTADAGTLDATMFKSAEGYDLAVAQTSHETQSAIDGTTSRFGFRDVGYLVPAIEDLSSSERRKKFVPSSDFVTAVVGEWVSLLGFPEQFSGADANLKAVIVKPLQFTSAVIEVTPEQVKIACNVDEKVLSEPFGISGSPVFNRNLKFVGILTGGEPAKGYLTICPASKIAELVLESERLRELPTNDDAPN